MNSNIWFAIVAISLVCICLSLNPIKIHNYGDNPASIILNNDNIFTVSEAGILLSKSDGSFISNIPHTNTSSIVEVTKLPNGKITTYNGAEMTKFTKEGAYENQIAFVLGSRANIMEYTAFLAYDNSKYLLGTIDNSQLELMLIDSSTFTRLKYVSQNIQSTFNLQCAKRTIGEGFICSFIQNFNPDVLFVYNLDLNLVITKQVSIASSKGRILKLKHMESDIFSLCYLTYESDAYCSFFEESSMTLTKPTLVASGTDDYNKDKISTGVLLKKELLFVYVDNFNSRISAQKLSYTGGLIGNRYSFPITGSGYISQLSYLDFASGKRGVVYGLSGMELYFQEINIPTCLEYCRNVGYSQTNTIDLSLYSSTDKVQFTSLPVFGVIRSNGIPVVELKDYFVNTLEYESLHVASIGTGKYKAVNEIGSSIECSLNIFIGENANCPCPNNLVFFQDVCVANCPDFTYTDSLNKQCVNCASLQKYLYLGECKAKADLPESVYVSNINYNVVEDCRSPCLTCVDSAVKCLSCIPGVVCSLICANGYIYSVADGKCVPCYESCASCSNIGGIYNHHCLTCNPGFETIPSRPTQCYTSCRDSSSSRWFIDITDVQFCFSSTICPSTYPIYISDNNQCVESCSKSSSCLKCQQTVELLYNFEDTCVSKCPSGYFGNEKTNKCDKQSEIDIDISDKPLEGELGTIVPGKNITIIRGDNYTVEIYNSTEKGGNLALSQMDFSKCEKILRKEYSIPDGDILIFVKIDLDRTKEITNQVEYEVYDSKRTKLNLKLCDETTIDVTYSIKNSSFIDLETGKYYESLGIDIYNPNDPFFVDICFPFTTENGTDIILRDRLKDIYKNISLCEESCSYKGIDLENLTVTCTCNIKPEVNTKITTNFFTEGLTTVFTDSNFKVVTCYNLVFNPDILIKNVGFWFYLVLMVLHLPNWCYFFVVGLTPIRRFVFNTPKASPNKTIKKGDDYISNIIDESNNSGEQTNSDIIKFRELRSNSQKSLNNYNNLVGSQGDIKAYCPNRNSKSRFWIEENTNETSAIEKQLHFTHRNSNDTQLPLQEVHNNSPMMTNKFQTERKSKKTSANSLYFQPKRNDIKVYESRNQSILSKTNSLNHQDTHSEQVQLTRSGNTKTTQPELSINTEFNLITMSSKMKQLQKKMPSNETLDDFSFQEALLYDQRSFFRQLYICLKNRHSILVTFIKECLLELRCILIIVYLFENSIDFAFNALFFTDDLISKRYNYEGNLYFLFTLQTNFISSLFSFVVTLCLSFVLNLLSTSKNKMEHILEGVEQKKIKDQALKQSLKCLKIKLAFFFILELLLSLFFWYYAAAFCAVYQSSQWSWFTGGCMTFGLGLLFPIPISLGIVSLRYIALSHKKQCLFRFAQWCFRF